MPSFSLKRTVLSLTVSLGGKSNTENYLRYLSFSILRQEKHSEETAGIGGSRCNSKLRAGKTRTNFFPDFCALSHNCKHNLDFKFLEMRDFIFFVFYP